MQPIAMSRPMMNTITAWRRAFLRKMCVAASSPRASTWLAIRLAITSNRLKDSSSLTIERPFRSVTFMPRRWLVPLDSTAAAPTWSQGTRREPRFDSMVNPSGPTVTRNGADQPPPGGQQPDADERRQRRHHLHLHRPDPPADRHHEPHRGEGKRADPGEDPQRRIAAGGVRPDKDLLAVQGTLRSTWSVLRVSRRRRARTTG